ncbi:MAG: hypothetical protein CNIPEHKO_02828 [Anaerolineales bacterium]|nr:hypothetical protein [Anaerolineales bacterium]
MLTNQHKLARRIINHDERHVYMLHMCGLCHALGDGYGLPYRLATSHDMLLLSMLVASLAQESETIVARRCPLNPFVKVNTYKNSGSAFAAAAAIELFRASQVDHWLDSKGKNIAAFALLKISDNQHKKAQALLETLGFDSSQTTSLPDSQLQAECADRADAALPTAEVSSALFAMSCDLAKNPQNKPSLARVGAAYGEYIYLKDALDDFLNDCLHGQFNPLRKFSSETADELRLERNGITWLFERLKQIEKIMRENLAQTRFIQDGELLCRLLLQPVTLTIKALAERLKTMGDEIVFKKLGNVDALKALALTAPIPMIMIAPRLIDDINSFQLTHSRNAVELGLQQMAFCTSLCDCLANCGTDEVCTPLASFCEGLFSCFNCADPFCTSCSSCASLCGECHNLVDCNG